MEPRDRQLEAEILSQKITLISEFRKNIENEKHIIGSCITASGSKSHQLLAA
jgi:hypothetical protein